MRWALLLVCAGIASVTFVSDAYLALELCLSIIAFLLLVFLLLDLNRVGHALRQLLIGLLLFMLGATWHLHWAKNLLDERLPFELEGETLLLEGVVAGLPERSLIAQQFLFKVFSTPSGFSPRKVILNYYGDTVISPGQHWRFRVRLNRPHGFSNPGGFDYESWLFQQGISARGYVRSSSENLLISDDQGVLNVSPSAVLHSLRYSLKTRLQSLLQDARFGGLLIALLLGDRSAISQANWQLFTATGSNHLFVISGLHIGLISGVAFALALLVAKVVGVASFIPAQKFAALTALAAAFVYALLAGFSLPTQRAFIMIGVLIAGLFSNVRYPVSFRLLVAAFAVLLLNPLAASSSGFWLSFIAVAALLAFSTAVKPDEFPAQEEARLGKRIQSVANFLIRPQLVVVIALAAPLIFFTQQFSLLAPLVNIVAIPLVGFVLIPLCFLALALSFFHTQTASLLFLVADSIVSLLIRSMELLREWAGVLQLDVARPNSSHLLALFIAVLLLLLPRAVCRKSLALPLLLCIVPLPEFLAVQATEQNTLRFHVVDVGQGLAVIVETDKHVLLYDTGANLGPDFNIGSSVVVPALRALGIHKLDAVVVSHGDNDHAGGLSGVESQMKIQALISNKSDLSTKLPVQLCVVTNAWSWDGVEFRFLLSGLNSPSENNNSCVLQIRSSAGSILLPGDIEREAEAQLAVDYSDELASDVLLAPHHGSRSSSSYAFLKRVEPAYVVFSAGYRNSFGHPHNRVVARYAEFNTRTLATQQAGMISIEFGERSEQQTPVIQIKGHREENFRYWH